MPGPELGLSFAPTPQNAQQNAQQSQTPIQDAIKVLSLRIPRFVGAQAPVPGALLNAPGAGGLPGGGGGVPGGLEELLKRLFGGGGALPPIPKWTVDDPGGAPPKDMPRQPNEQVGELPLPEPGPRLPTFQPGGGGQRPSFGGGFRMPRQIV